MKALFVSNDRALFREGSDVRTRMRAYAAAIGELHMLSASDRFEIVEDGPLTLHGVIAPRFLRVSVLSRAIRELVRMHGIEIVSAQDPFEHGFAAMKGVKGTPAKLHVQVHTDFLSPWFLRSGNARSPQVAPPVVNRVRRHLADRVLPKAHGIRVVSKRVKDSLMERYGNRIPEPSVIPIGAGMDLPSAVPLPPHSFTFALITVGRLEPEKRIEDILHALARIGLEYQSVGLVIVGDGSERGRLERLAAKLGLTERVVFAGWQQGSVGMVRSAQAYIQASAYEGYGRTLIEAALARVPIITTDVGIVGDVLIGYEDVLAAPVGDPAALATHIRGLVEDHQARETYVRSAERKAKEHLAGIGHLPTRIAEDLARVLTTK